MGWQRCAAFGAVSQLPRFFPIVRTSFSRPRIRVFSFGNRHDGISFFSGLGTFLLPHQEEFPILKRALQAVNRKGAWFPVARGPLAAEF